VKLYPIVKQMAEETRTVHIPAHEIDSLRKKMSLNEIEALKIAELIVSFKKRPDLIVIDLPDPDEFMFIRRISKYAKISEKIKAEHKADANFPAVSAASILAKVERDAEVEKLEKKYGSMGSGYPSDQRAIDFLNRHAGEKLDFVRYSWSTAKRTISKKEANQSSLEDF
jgi:ribonuclease HII